MHFAVGRYVRQRLIRDVWARGIVHIKLIGDLPVGSGALEEARIAASYLAKYVSKNIASDERVSALHRYEVAQGFQPEQVRLAGRSERTNPAHRKSLPRSRRGAMADPSSDRVYRTRPSDVRSVSTWSRSLGTRINQLCRVF